MPASVAAWLGDMLEVFYRHYAHVIKGLGQDRAGLLTRAQTPVQGSHPALRVVHRG